MQAAARSVAQLMIILASNVVCTAVSSLYAHLKSISHR